MSTPPPLPPPSPGATELDLEMMSRALALARRAAAVDEIPVGAVVYHAPSGRVIGEAFNRRHINRDPTAHAELLAIREAAFALGDWRLNDYSLAVTLEPCCMCAGLIVNARVGRLLYAAPDPKAGAVDSLFHLTTDERLNHRVMPIAGVMAEEAGALLREFFQAKRNRPA